MLWAPTRDESSFFLATPTGLADGFGHARLSYADRDLAALSAIHPSGTWFPGEPLGS